MDNAQRTKNLLAPQRTGPLRKIILTQAHADHYGGVPALREPETQVIAERRFVQTWRYFDDLGPYLEAPLGEAVERHDESRREPAAAAGSRARHRRRSSL